MEQATSEAVLVARVQTGDREAFGELVGLTMKRAFGIAYRVMHDREDAEDVVQDAYIAALSAIDTFDTSRPFAPWLGCIVARKALNALEKRRVRTTQPLAPELADRRSSPADDAEQNETAVRVRAALRALPPRQRTLVEMIELDGYRAADAAALLGITASTARWHLHEARRSLRQLIAVPPLIDVPQQLSPRFL